MSGRLGAAAWRRALPQPDTGDATALAVDTRHTAQSRTRVPALSPNVTLRLVPRGRGVAGWAGQRPGGLVEWKSSMVKPPGTTAAHRPRLGRGVMAGLGEHPRGPRRCRRRCRRGPRSARSRWWAGRADLRIGAARSAGLRKGAVGDQSAVGLDRDVCLEPVLPAVHGLVHVPRRGPRC